MPWRRSRCSDNLACLQPNAAAFTTKAVS
jgi:hypothetical protein